MDDTFIVWPHGPDSLQDFHNHLNRQEPLIKFTMEHENETFLDILVAREEKKITTTVF